MTRKKIIGNAAVVFPLLLFAEQAAARTKPMNWRLRRKVPAVSTAAVSEAGVEASTAPAPARLMSGRWAPEVRAALDKLIAERGDTSAGYDQQSPPVAVFPWSDAMVAGDPAELVFLRLVNDVKFRAADAWWEVVPIVYGRQPVRVSYEQFVSLSTSVWPSQPGYHAWRKGMLSSYLELCRRTGRKECRSYLARLWAGYREDEAEDFAKKALDDEKRTPTTSEPVTGEAGDPKPLRARRGLRVIPEMRDLVSKLRGAGFDVWVVDDVPQSVLVVSAADYGVDPSRVYGVRNSTDGARLGSGVSLPVPTRGGKTEIVQSLLGRPAALALGRDAADLELLSYGDGLRIVLDSDPELVKKAIERGWLIQRSLAR